MKEKELLAKVRHVALATVNEDGTPHNTPLFCIYNEDLTKVYWGSHPDSLHSKNIEREGRAYLVIFDSFVAGKGGIYLTLNNGHRVDDVELPVALEIHNKRRAREGKEPLPVSYYQEPNVQKMYCADIIKIEVYGAQRDTEGHILKEGRLEVQAQELLS